MSTRLDIPTPALIIDRQRLDRNIGAMARWAGEVGITLRPHAKTHKTPEVARLQLEAGAPGLAVATLGEAETFAEAGVDNLFIAYPLWVGDATKARRLVALAERVHLRVGVDSAEAAGHLGGAVRRTSLEALIEIDCGHHRSGVRPTAAAAVADAAARAGLMVVGVFTFPGHGSRPGMPAQAAKDEADALEEATAKLEAAGHAVQVRSGGSTPTAHHTVAGIVTEIRPGTYVFNDAQQVALGTCRAEDLALSAVATVVSIPSDDRAVLDAGSKVLGADRPPWLEGYGLLPDFPRATVTSLSEHHAVVALGTGPGYLRRGDQVRIVPNHVCNAVNLVDELVVVDEGAIVGTWQVRARGKNA
jgi:D-serine deaminase-like pyridoxal phosphate-dependent protein